MWNKSPREQLKKKHRVLRKVKRDCSNPVVQPRRQEEKVESLVLDRASRKGIDITFWPSTKRRGFCLAKTDKLKARKTES